MVKDAKRPLTETIGTWAQEQWEAAGLRPEDLIARHQEICEQQLKQTPPNTVFQSLLNPLATLLSPGTGKADVPLAPVVGHHGRARGTAQRPEACRPTSLGQPDPGTDREGPEGSRHDPRRGQRSSIDGDDRAAAGGAGLSARRRRRGAPPVQQDRRAGPAIPGNPDAGAARAGREALPAHFRPSWKRRRPSRSPRPPPAGSWASAARARPRSTFGTDLFELIRLYAKTRYQCFVLDHINRLYVSLRGHLSDQVREVGFCRTRLTELAGLLEAEAGAACPRPPTKRCCCPRVAPRSMKPWNISTRRSRRTTC